MKSREGNLEASTVNVNGYLMLYESK